jgi:hypothetical protein
MRSSVAVRLLSLMPIPLVLVRSLLRRDNARENRKDSWQRLRGVDEVARYQAVRSMTERYAGDGFVLDIGCRKEFCRKVCDTTTISVSTISGPPLPLPMRRPIRGRNSSPPTDPPLLPTRHRTL